ncbi:MAG TPA: PHB depolymerase family esterase [Azospirillaceae bacterium]|nr:PHB depolymerase family esterase [Azospirillaceae bacterium]
MAAQGAMEGRLDARPPAGAPAAAGLPPGLHRLGLAEPRDGLVYVPASAPADGPGPLVLLLHGAGGDAAGVLPLLYAEADRAGAVLLAPDSRRRTWDFIVRSYGPDVAFIDLALEAVFASRWVDPARIAVAGFSDGASYALSLGLINGDLFTHVLAFAPGFMAPTDLEGRPAVYVSHGTDDPVLPVDACSRRLVPRLREAGYAVRYREFQGGHAVPAAVAAEAMDLLLAGRAGRSASPSKSA